jgi:ketosteroid isomerase-like protein
MRRIGLALATALAFAPYVAVPAAASDTDDVMTTVKEYLADLNNGDAGKFIGLCAPETVIIDDFPPHAWQGPTACANWLNGLVAFNQSKGITDEEVTIGEPRRVAVNEGFAYVVLPATYTYKEKGKPVVESGAVWTLALKKIARGWRVTGWAWGQG